MVPFLSTQKLFNLGLNIFVITLDVGRIAEEFDNLILESKNFDFKIKLAGCLR